MWFARWLLWCDLIWRSAASLNQALSCLLWQTLFFIHGKLDLLQFVYQASKGVEDTNLIPDGISTSRNLHLMLSVILRFFSDAAPYFIDWFLDFQLITFICCIANDATPEFLCIEFCVQPINFIWRHLTCKCSQNLSIASWWWPAVKVNPWIISGSRWAKQKTQSTNQMNVWIWTNLFLLWCQNLDFVAWAKMQLI